MSKVNIFCFFLLEAVLVFSCGGDGGPTGNKVNASVRNLKNAKDWNSFITLKMRNLVRGKTGFGFPLNSVI